MDDFASDKTDTQDVRIAVFLAEAQSLGEVGTDHIPVENGDLATALEEQRREHLRRRALAGTAQAREPDAEALLVAGRVHLAQDFRGFGAGKPFGQQPALDEIVIAHLRA